MGLNKLIELHQLARTEAGQYPLKRFLYERLEGDEGRHFTGIVGPRGAGKTVLLRQYAREHEDAFYFSADTLEADDDPWEIIRSLLEHFKYRTVLIDEAHFLEDTAGLLKRIYDFLRVRVIFSSSVALAMRESAHDLSRRVRLLELRNFSYREYVAFKHGLHIPKLTIADLAERRWTPEHVRSGAWFDDYLLRGGLLPFAMEEPEPFQFLQAIIEKVLARDIPSVARLKLDELDRLRRLLRFVGRSGVDGINYSSLSRNLGITKYKAEQYVACLEKAFILHRVLPEGTSVLREPKVLMAPPCRLLYREADEAIGGLREDFFVEAAQGAGISCAYLKSTRGRKTPDYLVSGTADRLVVEIGGKGKGRQQFKGIEIDRKLVLAHAPVPEKDRVPLYFAGYLA